MLLEALRDEEQRVRTRLLVLAILIAVAPVRAAAQPIPVPGQERGDPAERPTAPYKDPSTAQLFSFLIAGGGHLYTGETTKGATLLTVSTLGFVGVLRGIDCGELICHDHPEATIGLVAWLGAWIYGMSDADDSAWRVNRRNGYSVPAGYGPTVEAQQDRVSVGWRIAVR